jgi:hypothetical protein
VAVVAERLGHADHSITIPVYGHALSAARPRECGRCGVQSER